MTSNEQHDPIDSATPDDDRPVKEFTAHRAAARSKAARESIRAALGKGKGDAGEPNTAPAAEPANPEPATVADEPEAPTLDLHALRLRRQLAAERASSHDAPDGPTFEDLLDKPGQTLRGWIEGLRGESFADENEFKSEASDLISRIATDVLGVGLPTSVKAKLDAAAAKKMLKHSRTSQSKREAVARERAEREQLEQEWGRAADALDRKLAESETYRWLAAEHRPGELVVDVLRAAAEDGQTLTWEQAAKLADDHLKAEHKRRSSKVAPKKPEPAKVARVEEAEPKSAGPWTKDRHKAATLAMFRRGAKGSEP